jgi:hypothetical protein
MSECWLHIANYSIYNQKKYFFLSPFPAMVNFAKIRVK